MQNFYFYIQCFGCKVNQYENQAIREHWLKLGGVECFDYHKADLIYISTCAVTSNAVSDARQLLYKLNKIEACIWFCGCAVSTCQRELTLDFNHEEEFQEKINSNIHFLSQIDKEKLLEANPFDIQAVYSSPISYPKYPNFKITNFNKTRPIIKVQDGCSQHCSYCIVPLTRGLSRSRSFEDIHKEVQVLLELGFREMVISGVNLYQYKYDKKDFWDLYQSIEQAFAAKWQNRLRFRLSSLEPSQLNSKALDIIASSTMLSPHLHLSLQSGSPTVLERMHRSPYKIDELLHACASLQDIWQDFALGADFLLGFPGESSQELAETKKFVQALPLTYAHIFPYSIRPGTKAALLSNQLDNTQKNEHTKLIRELVDNKKQKFLEKILLKPKLKISQEKGYKGLCEYYITCKLEDKVAKVSHELLDVQAIKIQNDQLIVRFI